MMHYVLLFILNLYLPTLAMESDTDTSGRDSRIRPSLVDAVKANDIKRLNWILSHNDCTLEDVEAAYTTRTLRELVIAELNCMFVCGYKKRYIAIEAILEDKLAREGSNKWVCPITHNLYMNCTCHPAWEGKSQTGIQRINAVTLFHRHEDEKSPHIFSKVWDNIKDLVHIKHQTSLSYDETMPLIPDNDYIPYFFRFYRHHGQN